MSRSIVIIRECRIGGFIKTSTHNTHNQNQAITKAVQHHFGPKATCVVGRLDGLMVSSVAQIVERTTKGKFKPITGQVQIEFVEDHESERIKRKYTRRQNRPASNHVKPETEADTQKSA